MPPFMTPFEDLTGVESDNLSMNVQDSLGGRASFRAMQSSEEPLRPPLLLQSTLNHTFAQSPHEHHSAILNEPFTTSRSHSASLLSTPNVVQSQQLNEIYPCYQDQLTSYGGLQLPPTAHPLPQFLSLQTIHRPSYSPYSRYSTPDQHYYPSTFQFNNPQPVRGVHSSSSSSVSPLSAGASPATAWPMSLHDPQSPPYSDDLNMHGTMSADDEGVSDKPYARLIWEALMQAPGHRMMLRDIYDWFLCHTNKARDSLTNGWQNSIRHNLSMNQAFCNDKSESSGCGGPAKKANSVWVLTEDAIHHGVQSTTRYRKSGSGKKYPASKRPALARQQSGAKGGRAARRAARQRRTGVELFPNRLSYTGIVTPPYYDMVPRNIDTDDLEYVSVHTPMTPTNEGPYNFSSTLGTQSYNTELPIFYNGDEDFSINHTDSQHDVLIQPKSEPGVEETEQFQYASQTPGRGH